MNRTVTNKATARGTLASGVLTKRKLLPRAGLVLLLAVAISVAAALPTGTAAAEEPSAPKQPTSQVPAQQQPAQQQPAGQQSDQTAERAWTFVSMPDFVNVDTTYPQPGWEDALDYALRAVKAERPDFVLVAGDLVMGRWWTEAKVQKYAALYYPAWIERMQAHGLKFYAALGDHEIGDNPWPPEKAAVVPALKGAFRDYLKMPHNGPEHMLGTAFYFVHKNCLFVAVDVFETADGPQGKINAQVTGQQLAWLERVLGEHEDVDHVIVMGHTPVLGPVRKQSSSGLMLDGGRQSPLWQTMARHHVDLYLCGEVHAITCTRRDGVQQIAHGGLFGYNPQVNYLVVKVLPDRLELQLKQLDIICEGPKLWQEGRNRPHETVRIDTAVAERGYVVVGTATLDKSGEKPRWLNETGYFDEADNPTAPPRR